MKRYYIFAAHDGGQLLIGAFYSPLAARNIFRQVTGCESCADDIVEIVDHFGWRRCRATPSEPVTMVKAYTERGARAKLAELALR